jgi:hypothetical protein
MKRNYLKTERREGDRKEEGEGVLNKMDDFEPR